MTWTWPGLVTIAFILLFAILGFRKGFIREVVSTAFVILSLVLVFMINPYVNQFLRNNTPLEQTIQEKCEKLVEDSSQNIQNMGRDGQNALLESLGLPELLTRELREKNTGDTYRQLAVNSFTEYVTAFLTDKLLNGVSFLISWLIVTVVMRITLFVLDLIAKLPVIHGINRLAGAVIGAGKALLYIWILLLVLTVLCNTEAGKTGLRIVEEDPFLKLLYEQDVLIKIFLNIFYGKT